MFVFGNHNGVIRFTLVMNHSAGVLILINKFKGDIVEYCWC